MSPLVPCPECSRHVRVADPVCPFCGHALLLSLRGASIVARAPVPPRRRLGRAATFAFGATFAGATLIGCGGDDTPPPVTDSGVVRDTGPADSGGTTGDAEPPIDSGPAPVDDGGPIPDAGPLPGDADIPRPEGGPPDRDGGPTPRDDGGIVPLYGAPPEPA